MPLRLAVLVAAFALAVSPAAGQRYRLGDIPDDPKKSQPSTPEPQAPGADGDQPLVDEVAEEFYGKAVAALKAGKVRLAEGYFDRVLILKPDHTQAREGIRLIMKMRERAPDRAAAPKSPKTDPKRKLTHSLLKSLDAAYAARDWTRADQLAAKILAIDPGNQAALEKRASIKDALFKELVATGRTAENAGRRAAAIAAYDQALAHRDDAAVRSTVRRLERELAGENKRAAEKVYVSALKASQEGNPREALVLCRRALALDPDNIQAKRMLQRLLSEVRR